MSISLLGKSHRFDTCFWLILARKAFFPATCDAQLELAADSAIRAGSSDLARLPAPGLSHPLFLDQRTDRAELHAFSALDAGRFAHGHIEITDHLRVRAPEPKVENFVHNLIVTTIDAPSELNFVTIAWIGTENASPPGQIVSPRIVPHSCRTRSMSSR